MEETTLKRSDPGHFQNPIRSAAHCGHPVPVLVGDNSVIAVLRTDDGVELVLFDYSDEQEENQHLPTISVIGGNLLIEVGGAGSGTFRRFHAVDNMRTLIDSVSLVRLMEGTAFNHAAAELVMAVAKLEGKQTARM